MQQESMILGAWILLGVYAAVTLWLVVKGARKTKNITDYAVGSVLFSPVAVGLSLAASMTSAATFVINPGFIANYGWSAVLSFGIFLPIAAIGSLIIMTKSFRKYGQNVKALTLAQWIGTRYGSKGFSLFMAFLALLLITFIVLIVVALTKVIAAATQMAETPVMIALVIFVFGYMMFGGANSMVYTNTVQAVVMIIVAIILLGSGFEHMKLGMNHFWSKLESIDPRLVQSTFPESPLFRNYYEIIFAQIVVGIAIVVQPHIITKSLLLKNDKDVNTFLWTAALTQILFFSVIFVGFYARITFPNLTVGEQVLSNDGIIPAYVIHSFSQSNLGVWVGLFVILGLIGAGMSTLEGLIQAVSVTISSDIIASFKPVLKNNAAQMIAVNKIAILLLACVTIIMSLEQLKAPKLSVGIFAQNGVYAYFSAAFIPVILGIFLKKVPTKIPFLAAIIAFLTHFSVYYLLPYLYLNTSLSLGNFDVFLEGNIKNPAIAASTALLMASMSAFIMYGLGNIKKQDKSINHQTTKS